MLVMSRSIFSGCDMEYRKVRVHVAVLSTHIHYREEGGGRGTVSNGVFDSKESEMILPLQRNVLSLWEILKLGQQSVHGLRFL